jgi:hypothetical protein
MGRGPLQPLVSVLDHHDRGVDHRADGDGDAPRLVMLDPSPRVFIAAKAMSTPTGSMMIAISALRKCKRKTTQTSATITLSSTSAPLNARDILEKERRSLAGAQNDIFEIGEAFQIASSPNDKLGFRKLYRSAADIRVAGASGFACSSSAIRAVNGAVIARISSSV